MDIIYYGTQPSSREDWSICSFNNIYTITTILERPRSRARSIYFRDAKASASFRFQCCFGSAAVGSYDLAICVSDYTTKTIDISRSLNCCITIHFELSVGGKQYALVEKNVVLLAFRSW